MTELVSGERYNSKNGPAIFIAEVPDKTVSNGICYKFWVDGAAKYVRPYDLQKFLKENDADSRRTRKP